MESQSYVVAYDAVDLAVTSRQQYLLRSLEEVRSIFEVPVIIGHPYQGVNDMLLKHGRFFSPGFCLDSTSVNCYQDALSLALRCGFRYCEGVVLRENLSMPLPHAWCLGHSQRVVDPAPAPALEYWGIAFKCYYVHSMFEAGCMDGVMDAYTQGWPLLTGAHRLADCMDSVT